MVDIQHPATVLERGVPSRAGIGAEMYDIDDEGYFTVDDEATAVEVMERLAENYGVEYTDDGEIEGDATPAVTRVENSEDGESAESGDDSEETSGSEADDGEALAEAGADAFDRAELEEKERDDLREMVRDHPDVDEDEINLNKTEEMVAALLRADAESVSEDSA